MGSTIRDVMWWGLGVFSYFLKISSVSIFLCLGWGFYGFIVMLQFVLLYGINLESIMFFALILKHGCYGLKGIFCYRGMHLDAKRSKAGGVYIGSWGDVSSYMGGVITRAARWSH